MKIRMDFESGEALYMQLRNQIVCGIASSDLREGDPLPSVRQLAGEIGINMHTVNKAYALLQQEGLVRMDRRKGAVVAIDPDKHKTLEEMKRQLAVVLAQGRCRKITKEEVYALVDEIFEQYQEGGRTCRETTQDRRNTC